MSVDRLRPTSNEPDAIARLRARYARAWAWLRRIPGVSGLGIGLVARDANATSGARQTHEGHPPRIGWRVYVGDARARAIVPSVVFGFPTTIVPRSISQLCYGNGEESTLKPGIQITSYDRDDASGSIGCFAHLTNDPKKIVLLSGSHVLFQTGPDEVGREVGQPGVSCSWCCKCKVIASNHARSIHPAEMEVHHPALDPHGEIHTGFELDAAIALVNRKRPYTNDSGSQFYGMIAGTPASGMGVSGGDRVEFVGSSSGHVTGTVLQWTTTATYLKGGTGPISNVQFPIGMQGTGLSKGAFINHIFVVPDPDPNNPTQPMTFLDEGDSGAAVVNSRKEVIGIASRSFIMAPAQRKLLNKFLTAPLPPHAGALGVVSPIGTILKDLDIVIDPNMAGTVTASGDELDVPEEELVREREEMLALQRTLSDLTREARARAIGREILDAIDRHRFEVREHLDRKKEVTVAWHRSHGPAWSAHLLNSIRDHRHVIPHDIQGITRKDLLTRMAAVLRGHGSAALRADIARYEAIALEWATTNDTSVWPLIERLRRAYAPDPSPIGATR